jgi:hypothetical protein
VCVTYPLAGIREVTNCAEPSACNSHPLPQNRQGHTHRTDHGKSGVHFASRNPVFDGLPCLWENTSLETRDAWVEGSD